MTNYEKAIEAVKNNEKAMKRINKAISGEREMKDSYLEITTALIKNVFTWEEMQEFDSEKLISQAIVDIVNKK